ncbi:MAG: hypothetical protein J6C46_01545 [Clostridia bacterium]|nr:hypothetical protein [Clostridia bacterium]
MTINIAFATIDLEYEPFMFRHINALGHYFCEFTFEYASTKKFNNPLNIKLGETEAKAVATQQQILMNFSEANIFLGDEVAIIFNDEGNILALGKMEEDVWLDVNDDFKKKSFVELNVDITSLKIFNRRNGK